MLSRSLALAVRQSPLIISTRSVHSFQQRRSACRIFRRPKRIPEFVDFRNQTRILPDGSRVCAFMKSDEFMKGIYPEVTTLYEAVRRGAVRSNNGPMLGSRRPIGSIGMDPLNPKPKKDPNPYVWIHYDEALRRADNIAYGIRSLGIPSGQNVCLGIFAQNSPEWVLVENAAYAFNNVVVSLFETLGPDASAFIIQHADIPLVVCDTTAKVRSLLDQRDQCPKLKFIVLYGEEIPEEMQIEAKTKGIRLLSLRELEALGSKNPLPHQPPKSEDIATICYTSGTTGVPKGVILTHGNIIADGTTLLYFKNSKFGTKDVMISYLPMAHMFERVNQSVIYTEGGAVGFFRGDIRLLSEDIQSLRPTMIPVVPRLLNRIYDKVMAELNQSKIKKSIFQMALGYKQRELDKRIVRSTSVADRVVFRRIRAAMGGRVRVMITGSAPLAANVLNFIRSVMGCVVVEGYGQTEAVAAVTLTMEGDNVPGHVGVPSPCCAVKLIDVPQMGYFANEGVGEICVRGTNVFSGYYKNPEQTAEALDAEGWLHTGDIGCWTKRGTLEIKDRIKHIFKLAQGEYVAPEKIENLYLRSKYIAQLFVHGNSLKTCVVAVVVPDEDVLPAIANIELGIQRMPMEELCKRDDIKQLILDDMIAIGKQNKLNAFEQVKDIYLSAEHFSVENQMLTPTLKTKRPKILSHFQTQIDKMYEKLE